MLRRPPSRRRCDWVPQSASWLNVGAGWNHAELAGHGIDLRARTARMQEAIQAMRTIWRDDEAAFHGAYIDFEPMWSWPKPSQPGGPPVYLGGNGPSAEANVIAAAADGWLPQCGPLRDVAELRTRISDLRQAGRADIPVTLFGVPHDAALLEQFAAAGVDRCLAPIRPEPGDEALTALDVLAEMRARIAD